MGVESGRGLVVDTAGDGADDHAVGVGPVGVDQIRLLGSQAAKAVMLCDGAGAQLQHVAQGGDPAALAAMLAQHIQGGLHGFGAGIVAILDDGETGPLVDALTAAGIPEPGQGGLDALRAHVFRQAHGDGGQGVIDDVHALGRHKDVEFLTDARDAEIHAAVGLHDVGGDDVAGGILDAEIDGLFAQLLALVPQQRLIAVEDGFAPRHEALQDLHLRAEDALPGAQMLDVHGADVVDQRHIGPGDGREVRHFAEMVHAHFHDCHLAVGLDGKDAQGQANIVVVVALCAAGAVGRSQNVGDHFLGGGLSHTAGDADDTAAVACAVAPGQCAEGLQGIVDEYRRHAGAHLLVGHDGAGALLQGLTDENMAVEALALQRDEQLAGLDRPGIRADAGDLNVGVFRGDGAVAPLGHLFQCQHFIPPASGAPGSRPRPHARPDGV